MGVLSEVEICNSALVELGIDNAITSLTQNRKAARLFNKKYYKILKKVMAAHYWNFAMKRATLAQVSGTTDPLSEYDYVYQLPSDCLRVRKTQVDEDSFQVESGLLYSNESSCKIQYIFYQQDHSKYSDQFVELLAVKLASECAYALTGSVRLGIQLHNRYEQELRDARSSDAQEGTMPDMDNNEWLNSRINNVRNYRDVEV